MGLIVAKELLHSKFPPPQRCPLVVTPLEGKCRCRSGRSDLPPTPAVCVCSASLHCPLVRSLPRTRQGFQTSSLRLFPSHKRGRVSRKPGEPEAHYQEPTAGRRNYQHPNPRRMRPPTRNIPVKQYFGENSPATTPYFVLPGRSLQRSHD